MLKAPLGACLAVLVAFAPHTAIAGPKEDFEQLREDVWQWRLDHSPWLAMRMGERRGDGKLGDVSLARYEASIAEQEAFLGRLEAIDADQLPDNLQVDYALMKRDFSDDIAGAEHAFSRYQVFNLFSGPQGAIASLPHSSPLFTAQDYESYLGRLEAFPTYIDQMIERSRGAIAREITHSCEAMEKFPARVTGLLRETPEQSIWWKPFAERPGTISEADWSRLESRARTAIADGAFAGLRRFAAFYAEEYAPNCRDGLPGVGNAPGGQAYYAERVRAFTTTEMTPQEVHELGLAEVTRIRAEMLAVARKAGFADIASYAEHLRTDPQYYPQSAEELMLVSQAIAKEIDGWMPRLFGTLPRLPYTVQAMPAETAPGNVTAYYERGSMVTGQPGIYRVNTTELDQRPFWEIPALSVHEGVPGHHHQIALQQELEIHPLRSHGTGFTVFSEGWGLYSERLGIEMGLYDTPAKDMGRLSYEIWRATRLVVDTGIHALGWSKEEAAQFMRENTVSSEGNIDAELNRYITITWPGQALAYKVGELKIRELRERAENELGAKFDLRAFHDAVLENGAVPLDVLDTHIERWIASQQA